MSGAAAVAAQELRRRLRRRSTLVALALVVLATYAFVPPIGAGYTTLALGGERGYPNAAYVGTSVAVLAAVLLSLAGFYLLHGGVARDAEEGLGPILAATPIPSAVYLAGKFLGGAGYLLVLGAAAALGALALFPFRGVGAFDPVRLLWPFVLAVPAACAWAAAAALLFDVAGPLRGRGGDVLYFFLWSAMYTAAVAPVTSGHYTPWTDPAAGGLLFAELKRHGIDDVALGVQKVHTALAQAVRWDGFPLRPSVLVGRLQALAPAAILALAAVPLFSRFDPARRGAVRLGTGRGVVGFGTGRGAGRRLGLRRSPSPPARFSEASAAAPPAVGQWRRGRSDPGRAPSPLRRVGAEVRLAGLAHRWPAALALVGGAAGAAVGGGFGRATILGVFLVAVVLIADLPVPVERGPRRSLAASLPGGAAAGFAGRALAVPAMLLALTFLPALRWQLEGEASSGYGWGRRRWRGPAWPWGG